MNTNTLSALLIFRSSITDKGITLIIKDTEERFLAHEDLYQHFSLQSLKNAMYPLYRLAEGTVAVTFPVRQRHGVYSF
jgi:hypothetical protein